MNKLSNDILSNIKQLVDMLCHYLQWSNLSLWIKLKFEKHVWMKFMWFNLDLSKSDPRSYIFKDNDEIISLRNLSQQSKLVNISINGLNIKVIC